MSWDRVLCCVWRRLALGRHIVVRRQRGLGLLCDRGNGCGVLSLLVLWTIVNTAGLLRQCGACVGGYGGGAGRALTLVRRVQPGNVDAVDLVHGRDGCLGGVERGVMGWCASSGVRV